MSSLRVRMRSAMAMIELIFAIVIIAISIITIPTMMGIANQSSKRIMVDDDIMARLSGQMMDKFQARWGGEYILTDSNATILIPSISELQNPADLNCSRSVGANYYRINPDSLVECNITQFPLAIPSVVGNGATEADGNVTKGIEKLNGGTETLSVVSSTGEAYDVNATYNVRYVDANVTIAGNTETATWKLGSSGTISSDNGGYLGTNLSERTHLKRVVVRFWNDSLGIDTTLTFYKSNKGGS